MATLCGLGNLECGHGNLELWPIFSISYASYFAEAFLRVDLCVSDICSLQFSRTVHVSQCGMKQDKAPHEIWGCFKGGAPKKLHLRVIKVYHCIVWSWKISLK